MKVTDGSWARVSLLNVPRTCLSSVARAYALLGLPRGKLDNLTAAYRRAALTVHPDKCDDERAEAAFTRLQEAFLVLSDVELRSFYDAELRGAKRGGPCSN